MTSIVRRALLLMVLGVLLGVGVASASAANYGAIAYSPRSGSVGYSYNFSTQSGAIRAAMRRCNHKTCRTYVWFRNACGAVADSKRLRRVGFGWSYYRVTAQRIALRKAGRGARLVAWACTAR